MKIKLFFYLIALSACTAYHHGGISGAGVTDASHAVVDFAHGYAKVNRFLFLGGANRDVLIADAKRNMLLNHPLEEGQFFTNYIVDFKETFYFYGIHSTTVTITAEVVQEGDADFLDKMREDVSKTGNYKIGQEVFVRDSPGKSKINSQYRRVKILSFKKNRVIVGYMDNKNRYRVKSFPIDKIVPGNFTDM